MYVVSAIIIHLCIIAITGLIWRGVMKNLTLLDIYLTPLKINNKVKYMECIISLILNLNCVNIMQLYKTSQNKLYLISIT